MKINNKNKKINKKTKINKENKINKIKIKLIKKK